MKGKPERLRKLRLGDLQKFMRFRYRRHRYKLPDDDAGREDLRELLLPISIGPDERNRMMKAIEVYAEWMSQDEAHQLIDEIDRTPIYLRKPTARELGDRLRVSNREREFLKLKTIKPFDMTDDELLEQRKAKQRARMQRLRRASGSKPHEASLAKLKPWKRQGISRRTWFRRRANGNDTSVRQKQNGRGTTSCAMNLTNNLAHISATESVERLKERKEVAFRKGISMKKSTNRDFNGKERENEFEDKLLWNPGASRTNQCQG